MSYTEIPAHTSLSSYIDTYWTLTHDGEAAKDQCILPDGRVDMIFNLGARCTTAKGSFALESEKAYLIGAMTTFTTSSVFSGTKLLGIRFKPAAFQDFFFAILFLRSD